MQLPYDLLIVGAGPVGCVLAERAATVLNWRVLLIDRRSHIAGNCFDSPHLNGVLIHHYGPHYFRTRDRGVFRYLSQFTDWVPAYYVIQSLTQGQLFPFPINLDTLEKFFDRRFSTDQASEFLDSLRERREILSSEDFVLNSVGRALYNAFYRFYTFKQWELPPHQLSPEVCGRIPVRFNRDPRYTDAPFQMMPERGFTQLFQRMIQNPRITLQLQTDFNLYRTARVPVTVYTGPIDAYFHHCYGRLPYRSLTFDHVPISRPYAQPYVQINYPTLDIPFTRSVEIKHITRQVHPETVVTFETPASTGEPYYPIPTSANQSLYHRYNALALRETQQRGVYFCGRLAQYRYFNTDEVIREALTCFRLIQQRFAPGRSASSVAESTFPHV
jgi:UDP-galactopyranose mutase